MYKQDLALNNLQWLICNKTDLKIQRPSNLIYEVCTNGIQTKAIFTKTEMNNKWNVHFLQSLDFQQHLCLLYLHL